MSKKRVTIVLDLAVVDYIDSFAKTNGISRSGAISVMAVSHRQSNDGIAAISELISMVKAGVSEVEISSKEKEFEEKGLL